jgi:putative ABC transport system substrate-binding protein
MDTTLPRGRITWQSTSTGEKSFARLPAQRSRGHSPRARMALRNRLPSTSSLKEFAEAGLLLSYGPDFQTLWSGAAVFIDKIFKGAKPADLPVEQPTKFELVVNLKTAKALGIDIPPTLLARADKVID